MNRLLAAGSALSLAIAGPYSVAMFMHGHQLRRSLDPKSFTISTDGCPMYDYRLPGHHHIEATFLPCASYVVSFSNQPLRITASQTRAR